MPLGFRGRERIMHVWVVCSLRCRNSRGSARACRGGTATAGGAGRPSEPATWLHGVRIERLGPAVSIEDSIDVAEVSLLWRR